MWTPRSCAPAVHVEINMTPLIDAMLALVVILMLTAPLALHRLPLPIAGSGSPAAPHHLVVSLQDTGEIYLDGIAMNHAQLARALATAANADAGVLVEFRPHAATAYDDVVSTLALAQASGITAIRVAGVRRN